MKPTIETFDESLVGIYTLKVVAWFVYLPSFQTITS